MTKLVYLGEHPNLTAVEDAKTIQKARYAFGWSRVDYPQSKNHRVMVAWVPGYRQDEFGLWPVYGGDQPQVDLGKTTQWGWDGNIESPTLNPSILHILNHPRDGEVETCHGYVRGGCWEPC